MNEPKWSWTKLPLLRNAAALLQFRDCCHSPDLVQVGNLMPPDLKGKTMKFVHVCPHGPDVFSGLPPFEIGNVPEKLVECMLTFFPKTYFNFEINKSTQRPTDYCNLPRYMCICAFKCIHIQLFACTSCHAPSLDLRWFKALQWWPFSSAAADGQQRTESGGYIYHPMDIQVRSRWIMVDDSWLWCATVGLVIWIYI